MGESVKISLDQDKISTPPNHASYVSLILAGLVGGGGLFTFIVFLYSGPFNIVNLGLESAQILLLDFALCIVFFTQHSVMARKSFRRRIKQFLPEKYVGAFYAIASGIVALILVLIWQESTNQLIEARGLPLYILRAVFLLSIINVMWVMSVGFLPLFRLQTIVDEMKRVNPQKTSLLVRGPYRWIRHPLYLSSLLMIWSHPDLTLDRLLFNILFSVWVMIAIILEERDLMAKYGDLYRDYREKVPMLIPGLKILGNRGDK
jgi:protein-S-isoprenylcysteine O-methyltransferase Ste14